MVSAPPGRPDAGPMDLNCAHCGSNRLRFPPTDDAPVTCEDCGTAGPALHELKDRVANDPSYSRKSGKAAPRGEGRAELRDRHEAEVDASQANLRESIAETDRLVDQSDEMLRRHRAECDEQDPAR